MERKNNAAMQQSEKIARRTVAQEKKTKGKESIQEMKQMNA